MVWVELEDGLACIWVLPLAQRVQAFALGDLVARIGQVADPVLRVRPTLHAAQEWGPAGQVGRLYLVSRSNSGIHKLAYPTTDRPALTPVQATLWNCRPCHQSVLGQKSMMKIKHDANQGDGGKSRHAQSKCNEM